MSILFLALNVTLMFAAPLVLGWMIASKRRASWSLFGIGAATFVLSQLAHIPFNWLVLQRSEFIPSDTSVRADLIILALFLGLSAGVFEETARYLTYRYWAEKARSWGQGLMLGVGHGGIEAMLVGVLVAANYVILSRMRSGSLLHLVPEDQLPLVRAQIEAVFTAPWHLIILGGIERVFALCFHLSASLMVMQTFVSGRMRWLFASILWHTLLNALAVFASVAWGPYVTEAVIGAVALLSLGIVFWLRRPEPVEPELAPLPQPEPVRPVDLEVTPEMLDKSRYT